MQSIKNIFHFFEALLANLFFGFPSKKAYVIGVTGTNGKTTTTQMIAKIIEESGRKVAISSTINFKIAEKNWVNKTKFTTPSAWKTQKFIKQAIQSGCEFVVLEISSHSLDQNRIWGVDFDAAVVTNITREHLDYHKTIEKYTAAKERLFQILEKSKPKKHGMKKLSVVNLEMEQFGRFLQYQQGITRFGYFKENHGKEEIELLIQEKGKEIAFLKAEKIEEKQDTVIFEAAGEPFRLKLIGEFNVENALAAICIGIGLGIDLKVISQALWKIEKIPGRLDPVENELGLDIIIDYAVTPDSMEKLGRLIIRRVKNRIISKAIQNEEWKKEKEGNIIWVFGSCGRRDVGKRPLMGKIVARFADLAIVTDEDPYDEDPKQIMQQVFSGLIEGGKVEGKNAWIIPDRREAIRKALEIAKKGDTILITGKGAEETMAIGKNKVIPWSDRQVVLEELKKIKN